MSGNHMIPYELDVTPFDSGVSERVIVWAENRARAFSLAALAAVDPYNVMRVELVSDGGIPVKGTNECGEAFELYGKYVYPSQADSRVRLTRAYTFVLELIGGVSAGVAVGARGRPMAFTEAAIVSSTPTAIWRLTMSGIARRFGVDDGRYFYVNNDIYGGITADFNDLRAPPEDR